MHTFFKEILVGLRVAGCWEFLMDTVLMGIWFLISVKETFPLSCPILSMGQV